MKGHSIIIPAYRERENLEILLPEIFQYINGSSEVIVMNDESGDGTFEYCNSLKRDGHPTLHCLNRRDRKGLAAAVVTGMHFARYENIIVMDGDCQHKPEHLPAMIEALEKHDLVVGTRYFIKGGECTGLKGFRKLGSIFCNLLAYPVTRLHDSTSGFFGFNKYAGDYSLADLDPQAFKIGLELYSQISNKGEVPISFVPRIFGSSKMTLSQVNKYFKQLLRLYIHKWDMIRMSKFYTVGAVGVVINYIILLSLVEWIGFDYKIANLIAIMGAAFSNFKLNVLWTFKKDD